MANTKLLLVFLALIAVGLSDPQCSINITLNESALFTTPGEFFPNYLDDYFIGTNLTFANTTELPPGHTFVNPIEVIKSKTDTEVDNEFVAVASYEESNGYVSIAVLSVDDYGGYDIWWGNSTDEDFLPDLSFKTELPMTENQYRCYDVEFVNGDEFVLGCVNITDGEENTLQQATSWTELILVRPMDASYKVYQFQNWESLTELPDNMKIRLYEPFLVTDDEDINFSDHFFDQTFILVSFLYEGYESDNQTSIDVFRYVLDVVLSNSVIIQHAPLDFSVLESWQDTLTISDFDAEGDHIFILDEYYGFYQFWLWGDEVSDLNHFEPKLPGNDDFVSLAVTEIEEEYYFTFLTTEKIYEYKIIDLEDESMNYFIKMFEFQLLGFTLEDYVPIESNEEYITVKVGNIMFIYERRFNGRFKGTIKNVGEYELLWSDDIFIFNKYLIEHRRIERPLLDISIRLGATEEFYQLDIKAISTEWNQQVSCDILLISEVFDDPYDKGIFYTLKQVGPEFNKNDCQGDLPNNFAMDDDYIGPNINYEAILFSPITEKVEEEKDLVSNHLRRNNKQTFVRGQVQPEIDMFAEMPRQVSYINIPKEDWGHVAIVRIEHETEEKFYAFFQFENFSVVIYECTVNDDNNTSVDCANPHSVKLDSLIDIWDVGLLGDQQYYVWSFVTQDDQIIFYTFDCIPVATISYYRAGFDIIDIEIMGDTLYIIYNFEFSEDPTTSLIDIRYFDPAQRFRRRFLLSYWSVMEWPRMTRDRWQPQKIMLSSDFENVAFVLLQDSSLDSSILLFDVGDKSADYIYHDLIMDPAEAYITGDSLFVYLYEETYPVIKEYSLRDLDSIRFMKNLPLYESTIVRGKVERSDSGILYSLCNDNNGTSLMIYHSHHVLVDSLYKKLQMPFTYNLQYPVLFHVDGNFRDTVIMIQNATLYFFRVPQHPYLSIYGHMKRDDYVHKFVGELIMMPWDTEKYDDIALDLKMRMINQQLYVKPDQDAFTQSGLKNITVDKNTPVATYILDNDNWFSGAVFNFELECQTYYDDCQNKNVQLINTVEKVNYDVDFIGSAEDIFYDDVDTERIYVLTQKQIYILDRNLSLVEPPIKLGLDTGNFDCDYMSETYSRSNSLDILFVFCQNKTDPYFIYETYVPVSFYTIEPFASTPIKLKEIEGMDDVVVDGDYILINDYEDNLSYGEIFIYEIDIGVTDGESIATLDKDYFGSTDPEFEIISFEVLPTDVGTTDKILVSTTDMNLYAVNYRNALNAYKNGGSLRSTYWKVDVDTELLEQDLYYTASTVLEKTFTIFFYPSTDEYSKLYNYFTLIHTSNTAIYLSELVFNESAVLPDDAAISMSFYGVFNNYGNFESQITMRGKMDADSFSEIYRNPDTGEFLFGVYAFELEGLLKKKEEVKRNLKTTLISEPINGAVKYPDAGYFDFNDNYEYYQDYSGQWHILIIDPLNQTLQGVKILDHPQLIVTSSAKAQKVRMIAQSDYSDSNSDYFEFNMQVYIPPSPTPKTKSKGFPWWGIVLIILGVLGLAAGGFFMYKLKFSKKNQSDAALLSLTKPEQAGSTADN